MFVPFSYVPLVEQLIDSVNRNAQAHSRGAFVIGDDDES